MLQAISEFIGDFKVGASAILARELNSEWTRVKNYLFSCKLLHAGELNAMDAVGREIMKMNDDGLVSDKIESEIKAHLKEFIENYIYEKIVIAQESMILEGVNLLNKRRKEVIMVIGYSAVFNHLFLRAKQDHRDFELIVVDTCPNF